MWNPWQWVVTMANYKPGSPNYSQLMRDIRPYVEFDFDLRHKLTPAQKSKISRYHAQIEALSVRPHQVFRTSNKKNLKAAQEFGQHDPRFTQIKVAFIPNANPADETGKPAKLKLEFNKDGTVTSRGEHVITRNIRFDRRKLVTLAKLDEESDDPEASEVVDYINKLIKRAPPSKAYAIQAGAFEISRTFTRADIAAEVQKKMMRYGADQPDSDPRNKNSHYWGNWLFGLNGYNFQNQSDLTQYRADKQTQTRVAAREKAKHRRAVLGYWQNPETREVSRQKGNPGDGWHRTTEERFYKLHHADGFKAHKK